MEKFLDNFWKATKIVLVILAVIFVLNFIASSPISNFFRNLFNVQPANVNANDGININYNGGLTKGEINDQKGNKDCPTKDDMYDGLKIIDLDDIVCFYKEIKQEDGSTIYPNLLFVKTDKGLIYNGATNIYANSISYVFGITKFYVTQQYEKEPQLTKKTNAMGYWYDSPETGICLYDSGITSFCRRDGVPLLTGLINGLNTNAVMTNTRNYINKEIFNKYFLTFNDGLIEIIMDNTNKDLAYADLNGFYDFVYRSTISHDFGVDKDENKITNGFCTIDTTALTCYPIPAEERVNYPMGDGKYFGVYKCNTYLNVTYEKREIKSPINVPDENLDEPIEEKEETIITTSTVFVNLKAKHDDFNAKTITDVVKQNPIKIAFYQNDNFVKQIVINNSNFNGLDCTATVGLANGQYTYKIDSAQLLFDSYSGSVTINNSSTMNFEYDYKNGYVLSCFSIEAVSKDLDISTLDLSLTPVRIVLNGKDEQSTIQFVFDNNSKIGLVQTQLIKVGKYDFAILSDKAIFGTIAGELEITPQNRNFVYKFALKQNASDLSFNVNVSTASGNTGTFSLEGDNSSVKLLQEKLQQVNYIVEIVIFSDSGEQLINLKHDHNGTGSCDQTWSKANILTENTQYTAQMTYRNGDGTIVYTGSTFNFIYKLNTTFTFAYSCYLVQ